MVRSNMFPTIEELRHTYERRRELAKELHAVDWEKLRMLRSKLRGDFEQITRFWQETRHDVGYIGLDVHEIQRRVPRVRARKRRVDVVLASRLERIDFSLAELPHVQKQISEAMRVFTEKKVLKVTIMSLKFSARPKPGCAKRSMFRRVYNMFSLEIFPKITAYNVS